MIQCSDNRKAYKKRQCADKGKNHSRHEVAVQPQLMKKVLGLVQQEQNNDNRQADNQIRQHISTSHLQMQRVHNPVRMMIKQQYQDRR